MVEIVPTGFGGAAADYARHRAGVPAALFERLAGAGGQVWMTGTEPGLFEALPGDVAHFRVSPGRIEAA